MGKKKIQSFDWKKFTKKGLIRLSYRAAELVILFAIGAAFGLKLIRY